ncbi:MAG TPA: substrate-binding domain-containing protein [Bacillota bacterium]|nr:substrate-binding domain-containing protein [Bacillota bacterium]HPT88311.1 substrate-binding domain-containing protein [Bacillota bacterium]
MKPAKLILWAICIFSMLTTSGCQWWNRKTHSLSEPQPIKIGLSIATLQEERWRRDRDYFAERIRQLGGELIVQNANNDHQKQLQQVDYLLSQQIKVLVIVPHDLNRAATIVQQAKKAGVKVISYDRLIRNADLDLYISFDNIKVGEFMAEYLVNRIPRGNYVIINGAPTDNNCYMFNQGYKNVLQRYLDEKQIEIIFEAWAEDWRPEEAYQYIQTLLSQNKKIDAVIAANDSLASAVIEALAEWRMASNVMVVGHDADLSGCQRIVEGTQLMTVYKPIRKLAYRAADLAMAMATGKELKIDGQPIFNGKHFIKSEIITPIPIDKDNMDVIIKDGFHHREDIYLNAPYPRQN